MATATRRTDPTFRDEPKSALKLVGEWVPSIGTFSILRDGVLHMRLNGSMADARNRISGMYNAYPGHHWSFDDE